MSAAIIALNRFGLGARVGEADRLDDPRGWLLDQVEGEPPSLVSPSATAADIGQAQRDFIEAARAQDRGGVESAIRGMAAMNAREVASILTTRIASDRPFAERLVAFWSNHLCVSSAGGARVLALAGAYEREAIRPHAFGRYEDLLLASARHPAMLVYLDNAQSVGPGSRAARLGGRRRRQAPRGLNENYARELLELHTVGVDGGYDQADVEELARILTGWTIEGGGGPLDSGDRPIGFRFVSALHEPGDKEVLGVRYREAGEEEGVRAIRDLAGRPETARFLATKLVRHFVSDEPPAAAVDRLAARWMDTGGDLRSVAAALVELEEAWEAGHRKFRTPQDWLVATFRASGERRAGANVGALLRSLRHQVWAPPSPGGYGDLAAEWADPDSLMNRAELARSIADRLVRGGRAPDPPSLTDVIEPRADDPLPSLLADRTVTVQERLALAFAGPAFQWR